jgi:hypothetical protein
MVFPSDYEVRRVKEEQMQDYVRAARVDRLLAEIEPRRENALGRAFRALLQWGGQILSGLGGRSEARDSENILVRYPTKEAQVSH